jgi:hypothetical protein
VIDVEIGAAQARELDPHDRIALVHELGLGHLLVEDITDALEGERLHARSDGDRIDRAAGRCAGAVRMEPCRAIGSRRKRLTAGSTSG